MGASLLATGCSKPAVQAQQQMQAMPVQVSAISLSPVPTSDTYVSTIKSRRSATLQPQVDGNLTQIYVHSGDRVRRGQPLMDIDPQKQIATVQAQKATVQQNYATYHYNDVEVERQRKLFQAGITSRDAYDQAEQAYQNSKAAYESAQAALKTQEEQLKYFHITAPFDGMVGDIPVHVGDYVSASTMLTTVDENTQLEAYTYIPTERASEIRRGLPVEILDNEGDLLEKTAIDFVSPQVDNSLQGILVKAPVHSTQQMLRNAQLVKARIIWSSRSAPVVPVLAVVHIGGMTFVYVAEHKGKGYVAHQVPVQLGDTVGNSYAVTSGLKAGDKVILSSIQFLADGMPVQPLG
ncbi:MAG: efflux RND transporter periplasmic adaptor subunit [Acidobacteriaceae bacterium]